ncbi:MAG: hypothetical protein EP329_12930 [Deltaproteobacteria bacterium]|nr:MAG: hypothetical protein EP329_12930 [Deltaproteobacteria bacterium]
MNVDSLPVPKLYNAIHPSHIRTVSRVIGVLLLFQWFLPWLSFGRGVAFSWDFMNVAGFTVIWSLLAGGGLTAFGFLKPGTVKRGVMVTVAAGIGLLGLFSVGAGFSPFPFSYFFPIIGLTTLAFGLLQWIRHGHSQLNWILVIVGGSLMLLGLLIPVGGAIGFGSTMPLVAIFKAFSGGGFILGKIFFFIFGLAYIGLIALAVLFAILPQANAEEGWLKLLFVATVVYLPISFLVIGLFYFAGGMAVFGFHMAVLTGGYMWLTLSCGTNIYEAVQDGSLKTWF